MQKGLCIAALTISVIVFVLFLADLILGHFTQNGYELAPFKGENLPIDVVFVVCSLILGLLSWFTYREQV